MIRMLSRSHLLVFVMVAFILFFGSQMNLAQTNGTGRIAYEVNGEDFTGTLFVTDSSGSNPTMLLEGAAVLSWEWSPDGKSIFASFQKDGQPQVVIIDVDTQSQLDITASVGGINWLQAAWSPDSTQIVFVPFPNPQNNGSIYLVNKDGSNLTTLTTTSEAGDGFIFPVWSLDGQTIYCILSINNGREQSLYRLDADGNNAGVIYDQGLVSSFDLSPDGEQLAFSTFDMNANLTTLHVADADGSNSQMILAEGGSEVKWSPDGQQIAFERREPVGGFSKEVFVVNADGSNLLQVTESGGIKSDSSQWSPDGNNILYIVQGKTYLVSPDGSVVSLLNEVETDIYRAKLQPIPMSN